MSYVRKIYRFRNSIEVEEYHSARMRESGQKRLKKKKPTQAEIDRINQVNREKKCRRKLRAYFRTEDYYTTLTYSKENRPEDMKDALKDFNTFIKKVRAAYKRAGAELRYIRNIEVGKHGAWHVHIVLNRVDTTDRILNRAWKHGKIYSQMLYAEGEFRELARYLTKTPKTDTSLKESNYYTSRNIPEPEPEIRHYKRSTWKEPKVPEGYYLDKESYREGINPLTGYRHREYTMLRIIRRE